MPKPLFYLGVVFSALIALLAFSTAPAQLSAAVSSTLSEMSPLQPLGLLLLSLPVAALFLRMASLIAARNLFAAQFSLLVFSCTALGMAVLSAIQFRAVVLGRAPASATAFDALSEIHLVMLYAVGFFLSVSLLSVRPYFRLQGRALASLVLVPLPLYLAILIDQYLTAPAVESIFGVSSVLTFLYLILLGTLFLAVSLHCLRHRHIFIEVTNLRELMESRVDPALGVRPRNGFRFDSDVAFDS